MVFLSIRLLLVLALFQCIRSGVQGFASYNAVNRKSDRQVVAMLSKALGMIYKEGGTLGVLKQSQGMEKYPASLLVEAALSTPKKGEASGILNALLGSCCDNGHAQKSIDLMKAYDESDLKPDLVALSLAYLATSRDKELSKQADEFLRRAEQVYNNPTDNNPSASTVDWTKLNEEYGIELLQDDKEFAAVSKPSGMVCYHATTKANAKNRNKKKNDPSLEECLLQCGFPLSTLNQEGRGMVHRIDRGTSGCIVLAKTNQMHAILICLFFLRRIEKSYKALVVGNRFPNQGSIDVAIDARPAKSKYTVEERLLEAIKDIDGISRIKIQTEQGRRHQVRIHCSQGLGAPILLDPLYGGQVIMASKPLQPLKESHLKRLRSADKFCLHANRLVIPDQGIDVVAPLPDWWQDLEQELRQIQNDTII